MKTHVDIATAYPTMDNLLPLSLDIEDAIARLPGLVSQNELNVYSHEKIRVHITIEVIEEWN